VEHFPGYGKLSHRRLEEMVAGARVEVDERKRHPMDFALWKASKPGEPWWESPWGKGRPGWHIECSVMSTKYLGQPFDLHGGGSDLIFPHHENEIAQSEGAKECSLARYWLHNGMVTLEQEKMSKSVGNILSIREAAEKVTPEVLRFFLLSGHYRSPLDFSEQRLEEAEKGLTRIYETLARVNQSISLSVSQSLSRSDPQTEQLLDSLTPRLSNSSTSALLSAFCETMDNDFNTARALGVVFETVRDLNRRLDSGRKSGGPPPDLAELRQGLAQIASVLGIMDQEPTAFLQEIRRRGRERSGLTQEEIQKLIAERTVARKAKDFQRADAIRAQLLQHGIVLKDTPQGTEWTTAGTSLDKTK